jgi:hypothetical protein
LALLLPGLIPLCYYELIVKSGPLPDTPEKLTLFLLGGVGIGVSIDLFRHITENIWLVKTNFLRWLLRPLTNLVAGLLKRDNYLDPKMTALTHYAKDEQEVIRAWVALKATEDFKLQTAQLSAAARKELLEPTVSAGDKWALLSVIDKDSLKFLLDEYFTFYELSFNVMLSLLLTLVYNIWSFLTGSVPPGRGLLLSGVLLVLVFLFQETAIWWQLLSKRFARKVIAFHVLQLGTAPAGLAN